jgi:uncharacterized membrane protein YhhN
MKKTVQAYEQLGFWIRALLIFFAATSLLFVILYFQGMPYTGSFFLKALPLLTLAFVVSLKNTTFQGRLIVLALLFYMGGDVALELDSARFSQMSMVVFLIANIFYLLAFASSFTFSKKRGLFLILISTYALGTAVFLRGIRPDMFVPVMIYHLTLTLVALFAFLMRPINEPVALGSIFLLLSGTTGVVNHYLYPVHELSIVSTAVYFLGHFLIASGFFLHREEPLRGENRESGNSYV